MFPLQLEVLHHRVVGHVLLARLCHLVVEVEIARIPVARSVSRLQAQAPRALREDFARHLQVPAVAGSKIVAAVPQIETARVFVAVRRHDESAAVLLREREIGEGNHNRRRHILDHQPCRTREHALAAIHFRAAQGDVEVGMFLVAGRVASVAHIQFLVLSLLRLFAEDETFLLLRRHIGDETLLRVEVVGHRLRLIFVTTLFEHRFSLQHTRRVGHAVGIHQTAVKAHLDALGLQLDVLIVNLRITVEVGTVLAHHEHD